MLVRSAIVLGAPPLFHPLAMQAAGGYSFSTVEVPASSQTVASGIDLLGRVVGCYSDTTPAPAPASTHQVPPSV